MDVGLGTVFEWALVPFAAVTAGGLIGRMRTPSARTGALIQHFAAGVVLGAVSVEVLPELREEHEPVVVIGGMVVGVLLMVALRIVSRRLEAKGGSAQTSFLGALTIDVVIDGMLVGVAFALSFDAGSLLAVIIAIEFVSLGLATGARLAPTMSVSRSVTRTTGLGAVALVSTLTGFIVLSRASLGVQGFAEAIGAVALIYLVTEELLSEAHEAEERVWDTAVLFAGFITVFVVVTR